MSTPQAAVGVATASPPVHLSVSVQRRIEAGADVVHAIITDVTGMGRRSPEITSVTWVGEPGIRTGARFKGHNRIGFLRWSTVATVDAVEPGRSFRFTTSAPSRSTWTYTVKPLADDACLVTESMTKDGAQPWPIRLMQRMAGVDDRAAHLRAGMQTTLDRIAAEAEASTIGRHDRRLR